ncbi:MAG: DUF2304 domain-containing protein [Clostridia bacterium]|nr:DUF2304 domain-containing protein [Clostridia bacterium]NCC44075.1 DUF2304 domain-containing protein [Clostridia bacterium]
MNIRTQVFVAVIVIIALILLINMIRKNQLELKYALLWFVLGIGILVFGCFPWLTASMANLLGIGLPINLLFFAGFCFSLMIIFSLTMAISRLSVKMKKMIQEIALLKKQMDELTKLINEKEEEKLK